MGKMKGQMFVITAIIIIIALVEIKGLDSVFSTTDQEQFIYQSDNSIARKGIDSLYEKAVDYSFLYGKNSTDAVKNITDFIRRDFGGEFFIATAYYNRSSGTLEITVINYLNSEITASVNTTILPYYFGMGAIKTGGESRAIFNAGQSYNDTINITINYRKKNAAYSEQLTVNRSSITTLVDYKMSDELRHTAIHRKLLHVSDTQQLVEVIEKKFGETTPPTPPGGGTVTPPSQPPPPPPKTPPPCTKRCPQLG